MENNRGVGLNVAFEDEKINFPVDCYYKVITEDIENMAFVIEAVLSELHVYTPVEAGNRSANGKYRTYNVTVMVPSLEKMNAIDAALRSIRGVKMVM